MCLHTSLLKDWHPFRVVCLPYAKCSWDRLQIHYKLDQDWVVTECDINYMICTYLMKITCKSKKKMKWVLIHSHGIIMILQYSKRHKYWCTVASSEHFSFCLPFCFSFYFQWLHFKFGHKINLKETDKLCLFFCVCFLKRMVTLANIVSA